MDGFRKGEVAKRRQGARKDGREVTQWRRFAHPWSQLWSKVEDFEVRRRTERGEKWDQSLQPSGTVEFFDPIDKSPELGEGIKVVVIDMNRKQPNACVRQDHVEERGGCLLEMDRGP